MLTPPFIYFALQVGMRHFHLLKNRTYTKAVNVDKLWSLLGEEVYQQAKAGKAPVLDVTAHVRTRPPPCRRSVGWRD